MRGIAPPRTFIAIRPLDQAKRTRSKRIVEKRYSEALMPSQRKIDRRNDAKLLTPLLLMALVIAAGVLFAVLTDHALAAI